MLRSLLQASIRTLLTNSHAKITEHAQSFCRCVAIGLMARVDFTIVATAHVRDCET